MIDTLFNSVSDGSTLTFTDALLTIVISIALGAVISWTYMKTQPEYTQNFTLTLIVLPIIIAMIIVLIGNNIARAFSLAGAFSIIRFRSAPGNPKDIAFVLFTMAAGLAVGVGSFGYAVLFTITLCLLMFILKATHFGVKTNNLKMLKVTIPENLSYEEVFNDIFTSYGIEYVLRKVRTTELGSLYELVYDITIAPHIDQKAFLDAIRCRNGNLDITLSMSPSMTNE